MYNQLPFQCNVLENMPMQYNMNQPPVMLRLNVAPELEQMVPVFTSVLANEFTASANSSELRRFTYNQMSNNNWNNNDFAQAVQFAISMGNLSLRKGTQRYIEHTVNEACSITAALLASANVNKYPAIKSYMDQGKVYQATQNIGVLNDYLNEINQMGGMQNNSYNQYPTQRPQYQQNNGFNTAPASRPMGNQGNSFAVGQNGNFQNTMPSATESASSDRYSSRARNIQMSQPTQEPQLSYANVYKESVVETLDKTSWATTVDQPYRCLFNTNRHFASYFRQPNGTVKEIIKQLEEEMNRSDHVINCLPGATDPSTDKLRTIGELDLPPAINKAVNVAIGISNINEGKEQIDMLDHWLNETSLDDAVFTARKRKSKANPNTLFSCNAFIAKPYIKSKDLAGMFESLRYAISFKDISNCLVEYKGIGLAEAFTIENTLTKEVNKMLKNNLSLDVTIGSFTEDVTSLSSYLHKTYGLAWGNAWDAIESENINNGFWFGEESSDVIDSLTMALSDVQTEENKDSVVTDSDILLQISRVNISLLDVLSKDLKYNLSGNEALLISSSLTPVLQRLAEHVFEEGEKFNIGTYVLVTKDDVKYQLSKGKLVNGSYLISLL